jgi:nickel-dependent lactate racemase
VEVNRLARTCDRLIVTGSIEMHYFGGFGGGRKALLPGVCSARTIAHNHALNLDPHEDRLDPRVRIGVMNENPVAEDMLEGARMIGADCVINTVLNRKGAIAEIFAGDLVAAHDAGRTFARRLFVVPIEERADLVIAASGGTRNFVQTHKALYNAYQAVKPGGRIILAAPCPEGLGGESFEKWLRLGSRDAIIQGLRRESEINGQTALSTLEKARVCTMVTQLAERDVKLLGAQAAATLPDALDACRKALNDQGVVNPTVYVMPTAAYTVPMAAGFDR